MSPVKLLSIAALAACAVAWAEEPGVVQKAADSKTSKDLKARARAQAGLDLTPSPPGARVYFIEPKNGADVKSPVKVVFGLAGMGIAPAGIQQDNTGHHHLVIDSEPPPANQPMGKTDKIIHYGNGQTEASVKLAPGTHTLQLVLGDYKHQAHNPPVVSDKITITVK